MNLDEEWDGRAVEGGKATTMQKLYIVNLHLLNKKFKKRQGKKYYAVKYGQWGGSSAWTR